jgi:hypothetical protein
MRKIIFLTMLLLGAPGVFAHDTPSDSAQEKDCPCGEHDCPETKEQKEIKEKIQRERAKNIGIKDEPVAGTPRADSHIGQRGAPPADTMAGAAARLGASHPSSVPSWLK